MHEVFNGLGLMAIVAVVTMLIVILAMGIDLISGIRKAKLRGEARTSYGFSRSLTKFLIYEGILIIALCIDMLLHFGLWQFVESNYVIPCVMLLMGIILCGVELWSVTEKADEKERRRALKLAQAGATMIDKEVLRTALTEVLHAYLKERNDKPSESIGEAVE